ncbi:hypothetical protein BZA05DRAFT_110831 [Tricharina praecox]|uniref:uncharacterized protein n=1 Tax=Tricharina praecox TaxID=43433 RepID=UPI00221FD548|nr:uncharacterized protein BZA05DRAFT_110831 [Tricharina praecox]KAI5857956.1 hypothetical protein BZA05DRAFT_110831 [Tricharina praecox]
MCFRIPRRRWTENMILAHEPAATKKFRRVQLEGSGVLFLILKSFPFAQPSAIHLHIPNLLETKQHLNRRQPSQTKSETEELSTSSLQPSREGRTRPVASELPRRKSKESGLALRNLSTISNLLYEGKTSVFPYYYSDLCPSSPSRVRAGVFVCWVISPVTVDNGHRFERAVRYPPSYSTTRRMSRRKYSILQHLELDDHGAGKHSYLPRGVGITRDRRVELGCESTLQENCPHG